MGINCKCNNCGKEVSKFTESKKASDDNMYCFECFSSLSLLEKENKSNPISIVGILLKMLSVVYFFSSLFSKYSYTGDIITENFMLTGITISLVLWALGTIVQKVCVIANNTSK